MKNKKKKFILFAAVDIGYRIEHYTKFIDNYFSEKLKAESFSKYVLPESHYKTKYTYTCSIDKTPTLFLYIYSFFFFLYSLFRFDIFHFISGETILTRKLRRIELKIYKLLGKCVIMHFVGSDIRDEDYLVWKTENIFSFLSGEDKEIKSSKWQKKLIKDAEEFADYIIVSTPDLLELIPTAKYYPVVIDVDKIKDEFLKNKPDPNIKNEIVILHVPSNKKLKGTKYINDALIKISNSNEYPIRLITPNFKQNDNSSNYLVSRYNLFKAFQEADIIIDQMIIGWYGLQSIEGLLAGKKVICYVDEKYNNFLYDDCPIVLANLNNINEVLQTCINFIEVNGKKSCISQQLEWVKKYHSIENNNKVLLEVWGL
jgi:hypothetical protein